MKLAHERAYEIETLIGDMRRRLARHAFDGVRLSPADVRGLVEMLADIGQQVGAMERELSATRWNGRAARDHIVEIVLAETRRQGSNLVLFPVIGRPLPGDDGGAAA